MVVEYMEIQEKFRKLKYLLSDESLYFLPEYQQRVKVSASCGKTFLCFSRFFANLLAPQNQILQSSSCQKNCKILKLGSESFKKKGLLLF